MMDEFHGLGGAYAVDPKTGQRTLIERTGDAAIVATSTDGAAESAATKTTTKTKGAQPEPGKPEPDKEA
jgi:hypothetical protein